MTDLSTNPPTPEQAATPASSEAPKRLIDQLKLMGPGIMTAAAAVGGSHLVASTKAGAIYGWQMLLPILLVNIFKYPFFRAGVHYTMATGNSLVDGYATMGRSYLWLFTVLAIVAGIVNTAALTMFSASILGYFLPGSITPQMLSIAVLVICLSILFLGRFQALDKLSKGIMLVLTIATLTAFAIATGDNTTPTTNAAAIDGPSLWSMAAVGFVVVTMGWMPAPIEISSLTSLWLKRQQELQSVTPQSAFLDFNVGYITTTLLALVFLGMGALLLHGSGTELSSSGAGFTSQLIGMYADTIGNWSKPLIAGVAFLCIFGSTITVIDGYARVIADAQRLLGLTPGKNTGRQLLEHSWMTLMSGVALVIILVFAKALIPMMNFAMLMAFLTTPIFALLNYLLVMRSSDGLAPSPGLIWLSRAGLAYLFGFLLLFIWWRWIM